MITKEELARQAADEIHGGASAYFVVLGALTAAFAAMPGPAVKVKPLEWTPWTGSRCYAYTTIGEYTIDIDTDEDMAKTPFVVWAPEESLYHFKNLDDAKHAAQSDYKMRILSALTPAPDLASENERLRAALHDKAKDVGPLTIDEIDEVFAALERT